METVARAERRAMWRIVALAAACIAIMLALARVNHDAAVWGFLLVPLGGVIPFVGGFRALAARRPDARLARARMLTGAVVLGTPGLLSSAYMLWHDDVRGFWAMLFLYAPLAGWTLFGAGYFWLRRASDGAAASRIVMGLGASLLSTPWLLGLLFVYYTTFIDDD